MVRGERGGARGVYQCIHQWEPAKKERVWGRVACACAWTGTGTGTRARPVEVAVCTMKNWSVGRRGGETKANAKAKDEDRHKAERHGARRHLREREGREHTARLEGPRAPYDAERDATLYRHCMTRRRPKR